MVADQLGLFILIDHVDVAVVGSVGVALVDAVDLDGLIDRVTSAVEVKALRWFLNAEVLRVLAAIELHKRCTVSSVEAGVFSSAEFVEFIDDVVQFSSERVEDACELSLLLLHVHQEAEEGGDQVVFATLKQRIVHLALGLNPGLLSHFGWVLVFILFVSCLSLFFIIFGRHAAIFADAELLTGALG